MLTCQRDLFALPEGLTYLNCAYMSPNLKAAEAAAIAGVRRKDDPTGIKPADFFAPVEELRVLLGGLVNASPDRVALIPSVSYGVALATLNTPLRRGSNVVVPDEEFPSNVYGWREQAATAGAEVRLVPRPADTQRTGRAWSERLLEAIDAETAAVSLTPLHWSDGAVFDVAAIAARAREVGALFVLDGTQWVGAAPFDFDALHPDLLVCAGYKWCLGPYSYGFAVLGDRLLAGRPLEEAWQHREGSENFAGLGRYTGRTRAGGRRFDAGEHANFVLLPMLAEGVRQILDWGVDNIRVYCAGLSSHLRARLAEGPFGLGAGEDHAPHLFGIHLHQPERVGAVIEALAVRRIAVSHRGAAIRVSPHLYNTPADMDALAEALFAAGG